MTRSLEGEPTAPSLGREPAFVACLGVGCSFPFPTPCYRAEAAACAVRPATSTVHVPGEGSDAPATVTWLVLTGVTCKRRAGTSFVPAVTCTASTASGPPDASLKYRWMSLGPASADRGIPSLLQSASHRSDLDSRRLTSYNCKVS